MNLSRREVFRFSLARKMLHVFAGTPLEVDMRSTLDKIATYIRERVWHPSKRLRERRDGSLEMRLETSSLSLLFHDQNGVPW